MNWQTLMRLNGQNPAFYSSPGVLKSGYSFVASQQNPNPVSSYTPSRPLKGGGAEYGTPINIYKKDAPAPASAAAAASTPAPAPAPAPVASTNYQSQIADLTTKVTDTEKLLEDLKIKSITDKMDYNDALQDKRDEYLLKIKNLNEGFDTKFSDLEADYGAKELAFNNQITGLQNSVTDNEQALANKIAELGILSNKFNTQTDTIANLTKDITGLTTDIGTQKDDFTQQLADQASAFAQRYKDQGEIFSGKLKNQSLGFKSQLQEQATGFEDQLKDQATGFEGQLRDQFSVFKGSLADQAANFQKDLATQTSNFDSRLQDQEKSFGERLMTTASNTARGSQTANLQLQPASSSLQTAGTQAFKIRPTQTQSNYPIYSGLSISQNKMVNV